MSEYLAPESSESPSNCIYDLYAVANHIGDLSRGHYTAFVNCQGDSTVDPKTPKAPLESMDAHESVKGRWFLFDDDAVEEVPASRIVSGAAYVLFYKRRKLTPSNIINLTA
jgi:ubiquitin C-terminal hydrolase